MSDLENYIAEKFKHLKPNHLFIACSGGLDSMTLLYVFNKLNFDVTALHVNYQLRGEQSELDSDFVQQFCTDHSINFQKKVVPISKELQKGGNLQALAREVRYNWFEAILSNSIENRILLGHHKDDQLETFYLNLARKSGVMGLASMLETNGKYLRPLLNHSKEEIKSYANNEGLEWREDKSNSEIKYNRNKLRNVILPAISKEIPTLTDSVVLLTKKFQDLQLELETSMAKHTKSILGTKFIDFETFDSLSDLERVEMFRQLHIHASVVSELKRLTIKGSRIALSNHSLYEAIVKEKKGYFFEEKRLEPLKYGLRIEKVSRLPDNFSKDAIYLDQEAISGTLKLRHWRVGDRIKSVGMNGSQLISDIIKDAHLRTDEKNQTLVVEDDKNILWCVGLKVARNALATNETKQIIKVTVTTQKSPK